MLQLSPTQWIFIASIIFFGFMAVFVAWASPANRRADRASNNLHYAVFSSIMCVFFCVLFFMLTMTSIDLWFWAAMCVNSLTAFYIVYMNWYNFSVSRRMVLERD